jgi:hypothetical protein
MIMVNIQLLSLTFSNLDNALFQAQKGGNAPRSPDHLNVINEFFDLRSKRPVGLMVRHEGRFVQAPVLNGQNCRT